MPAKTKTWSEKLHAEKSPQVKRIESAFADIPANGLMLISTPQEIDKYVKTIPKGRSVSIQTLRKDLAAQHNAEYTCPVTTGIFLRIVAEAAYEQYQEKGSTRGVTPFWRAVDPKSPLAKKLSCGTGFLSARRQAEKIED